MAVTSGLFAVGQISENLQPFRFWDGRAFAIGEQQVPDIPQVPDPLPVGQIVFCQQILKMMVYGLLAEESPVNGISVILCRQLGGIAQIKGKPCLHQPPDHLQGTIAARQSQRPAHKLKFLTARQNFLQLLHVSG